jgi:hypothetical protein
MNIDTVFNSSLEANKNLNLTKTFYIPADKVITQPYWLEVKMNEGYYNVDEQELIGKPDVAPAFITQFHLKIQGEDFVFEKPVRYRSSQKKANRLRKK